jgi:hypothetical protein
MRKVVYVLIIALFSISCAKEFEYPAQFDSVVGSWEAYQYKRIDYVGGSSASVSVFDTDSIGMEYMFTVSEKRIEIINSLTSSSMFYIRGVEVILENTELINFRVLTYLYPAFENKEYEVVYRKNTDELQVQSCSLVSPNGNTDYCDIYCLKRMEE